jgi:hypothetical protein
MQVRHLVPIVVLVAIALHGGKIVKAKVSVVSDAKGKVVVRQRMSLMIDMLSLEGSSGGELPQTQEEFQQFCMRKVKTRGGGAKEDQYKDPWGTPLKYSLDAQRFYLISAGPDLKHGTKDDIKSFGLLGDY